MATSLKDSPQVLTLKTNMPPVTALLVVDATVWFQDTVRTVLPQIQRLIAHFQDPTCPSPNLVVFTQHGHSCEELTTDPSPNMLVRRWGVDNSIPYSGRGWRLVPELESLFPPSSSSSYDPHPSVDARTKNEALEKSIAEDTVTWPAVIHKNTYDAFLGTPLQALLRSARVERVVVCGVLTDMCVDTSARAAFMRGWETWLVRDASATASEEQQRTGLAGFGGAFGEVVGVEEVLRRLKREGGE